MNTQSAHEHPTLRERLREWFHPSEARLRAMYRIGYNAGKQAMNAIPAAWRGMSEQTQEQSESDYRPFLVPGPGHPMALPLPAPSVSLIAGIAGGPRWDGAPGTWIAEQTPRPVEKTLHLTADQRRDLVAALSTQPKKPSELVALLPAPAIASVCHDDATPPQDTDEKLYTLPPERFLLSDNSRDELFADVPENSGPGEPGEPTVVAENPSLYRLQHLARHKQKEEMNNANN